MKKSPRVSGVIFDMDGVLVASGPAHAASWRIVAKRDGIVISDADFLKHFGRPSRDIIRLTWGDKVTDADVKRIDQAKEAAYRELIRGLVPLTIGTRETLNSLKSAGILLAIGTSGPRENVELVVSETRLAALFDVVVTGDDIQHGKPAPDCFQKAAEKLGLHPHHCVVIEDAPVGVQAAKAANMKCVGFVGTHPAEKLRDAGVDVVVSKLGEITPTLVLGLTGCTLNE